MSSILMAWLLLATSVLAEVIGTIALKFSNGFTHLPATISAACCFLIAIWLMSITLKHIEMGITYAVWAGSATGLLAVLGIVMYGESISLSKLIGMLLVIVGVIVLNLGSQ